MANKPPLPPSWIHTTPHRSWHGPLSDLHAAPLSTSITFPWLLRSLHVLRVLTRYDFQGRYRAQALGVIWSLLNPLVMMVILSLVVILVFHDDTPNFPIFVLIGLLVWQWISNGISAGTQSFVANADLIKRTVFARETLPAASVLSYGINFCLESLLILVFIPVFPGALKLTPALLVVPLLVVVLALLILGVALATSVLNVIYRDVAYIVNTGLSIAYWLTGVFYPFTRIRPLYRHILLWNPAASIIAGLRGAVMEGVWPNAESWMMILVPTLLVLLVGWWIFQRHERMALDHV